MPRRGVRSESDVVLLCNPRAGGKWRDLATLLDSPEARATRRIVTDSVEDVAAALADLEANTKLLCIYGGDGTIQRVLDRMTETELSTITLAFLGGGTMNVTSRWLGMSRKPLSNFRHVVRGYRSAQLLYREIPVLRVDTERERHRCFTFGMGPLVRILDAYERGPKGKLAAVKIGVRSASAALLGWPPSFRELLELMPAEVTVDGERLPYDEFTAVFANVTGQVNPGIEPFNQERSRDGFHVAAFSVSARQFTTAIPMLARGWIPVDVRQLFSAPLFGRVPGGKTFGLPADARYVRSMAKQVVVEAPSEKLYTVDGEVLETSGQISVTVGPTLRLCAGPRPNEKLRLAAERAVRRWAG